MYLSDCLYKTKPKVDVLLAGFLYLLWYKANYTQAIHNVTLSKKQKAWCICLNVFVNGFLILTLALTLPLRSFFNSIDVYECVDRVSSSLVLSTMCECDNATLSYPRLPRSYFLGPVSRFTPFYPRFLCGPIYCIVVELIAGRTKPSFFI